MDLVRNRTFLLLMLGEVIAGAGLWIFIIGNLQFMQHLVPSDTVKGLILMSGLFVGVLLSPKAGVIIDRSDKKKILFYSSVVRCFSPLLMIPAINMSSIWLMVLALIILQGSNAFYLPAVQSSLPAIVGQSGLLRANSVYLNIVTLSRIGGTAVGGILVTTIQLNHMYLFTLATNVFLAVVMLWIHIPKDAESKRRDNQEIRFTEIFALIKREPAIISGLLTTSIITVLLGGINLLILNFSEMQQSPELMGWIYTVEGSSILIAGLISKRLIGNQNLITLTSILLFVFALSEFSMSFADNRWAVLIGFAIFGATVAFYFPSVNTIFQRRLPPETQGRFFAFKGMIERVIIQLAVVFTGICLDLIGISLFMLLVSIVTVSMGIFTLVYAKKHPVDVRQNQPEEQAASL
ncbi:MAG: MFS transporter [Clostridia bacterium]